ncbi:hypothetical protein CDAR_424111 [Caerostris darwini]|uniref:Ribosomal protein L32 n=1 Tax=Caerostris darwini TaxID=1538125 RepID=A0AAV4T4G4_9ARAC|nr:hypothetical protein CDAR_424111 [Caerostris darwini]
MRQAKEYAYPGKTSNVANLRCFGREEERGSGEKKSHLSNDITQFVFLKSRFQMKWLLQKNIFILPAILRRSSIRKTTLTFQGFLNLTPAKRNRNGFFPPFSF